MSPHRALPRRLLLAGLCLAIAGCGLLAPGKGRGSVAPSAEELLREGDSLLAAGDFDGAAESLGTLIEAHPQSELAPQALFHLTAIYLSEESPLYDPGRGATVLSRVVTDHPRSPMALAAEAVLALLRENRDLRYEDLVESTAAAEILAREGAERLAEGDTDEATAHWRRVVTDYPESREAPEALFRLALLHLDPSSPVHDRREGDQLLARLEETYPTSTWALAGAALASLSSTNVDLRRAVSELRDQLEQLKRIDLDSDG